MNLKELNETWEKSCPEEANGLAGKRRRPRRWSMKLQAHRNKKKQTKCLLCKKLAAKENLKVMKDGGSGYCCSTCYQLS